MSSGGSDEQGVEYQAVCGSWDCRAPECKPKGKLK